MQRRIVVNARIKFPLEITFNAPLDVCNSAEEIQFTDDSGQAIDAHIEVVTPEIGFIRITPKNRVQPGNYSVSINKKAYSSRATSVEGPIILTFHRDHA